jgi:hypothetical protein
MLYWSIEFEWHTRPRFKKGRLRTCRVAFAAPDQTEAYRLAKEDGKARFPRHKWQVLSCTESDGPHECYNSVLNEGAVSPEPTKEKK